MPIMSQLLPRRWSASRAIQLQQMDMLLAPSSKPKTQDSKYICPEGSMAWSRLNDSMDIQSAGIESSIKGQTVAGCGLSGVGFLSAAIQCFPQRTCTFGKAIEDRHFKQTGMPIGKQAKEDRILRLCEEA